MSQFGEGFAIVILWVAARGATKYPIMYRTAPLPPTIKNYPSPGVSSGRLRKSDLKRIRVREY